MASGDAEQAVRGEAPPKHGLLVMTNFLNTTVFESHALVLADKRQVIINTRFSNQFNDILATFSTETTLVLTIFCAKHHPDPILFNSDRLQLSPAYESKHSPDDTLSAYTQELIAAQ